MTKYPDNNPKSQFGIKKPSLSYVPASALYYLGQAMEFGALYAGDGNGYGPFNWRGVGVTVAASVYHDARLRHDFSWYDGREELAPDSLAHHLGHSMACDAILLDALICGNLLDDRPPTRGNLKAVFNDITANKAQLAAMRAKAEAGA